MTALIDELADMMTATGVGGDLRLWPVKNVMKLTMTSKMFKKKRQKGGKNVFGYVNVDSKIHCGNTVRKQHRQQRVCE